MPPGGVLESDIERPTHTVAGPMIAEGKGLTVCTRTVKQPVLTSL